MQILLFHCVYLMYFAIIIIFIIVLLLLLLLLLYNIVVTVCIVHNILNIVIMSVDIIVNINK